MTAPGAPTAWTMGLFGRFSGLDRLAERFPAGEPPEGEAHARETVQVGAVRYRRCVTVVIDAGGLYLRVAPPVAGEAELLIPWDEIREITPSTLYGRKAIRLTLGDGRGESMTIYREMFERIRPYLEAGGDR